MCVCVCAQYKTSKGYSNIAQYNRDGLGSTAIVIGGKTRELEWNGLGTNASSQDSEAGSDETQTTLCGSCRHRVFNNCISKESVL